MASSPRQVLENTRATRIITSVFSNELVRGLTAAAESREEATPSPIYSTLNFPRNFQSISQSERAHFKPAEAEKLRQLITNTDYWRREVEGYEAVVSSFKENTSTMEDWRNLAKGYKRLLIQIGFTRTQVDEFRLNISEPTYWEPEAEHFKWQSKHREYEFGERLRRRAAQPRRPHSTRQPSLHSNTETQQAGPVSSRTRSRCKPGGVTKRQTQNERARRRQP